MTDRTARTEWEGALAKGKGRTEFASSGIGTFDVSWPARAESPDGKTSPEEMLAAAHSSCFSMALSNEIDKAGGTPQNIETRATVTLDTTTVRITTVAPTVRARVDGMDAEAFEAAAQAAKNGCPVSQLFNGNAEITLDAALS
ncbi:Organic hydroperoxide resistance protein [Euzebya pacifica]|uniref:Organic hydroperoxide resistance protein n=1 Tax=Euzebya pacifica TaxID=1608957 RepID=A0A346XRJ7_9ACTN|nr:OsmC family peroxiredoxin [Euzebya pacifica]AXV04844.1 Organic hydroperoxide resistance protein [Euzebya pacifica]